MLKRCCPWKIAYFSGQIQVKWSKSNLELIRNRTEWRTLLLVNKYQMGWSEIGNIWKVMTFLLKTSIYWLLQTQILAPEQNEYHFHMNNLDFSISPTVGGCELGGLRSSSPSQGQVHRGAAEVNLDLTRGTWAEVARGAHPLTPLKSPESKAKFTEAQPRWTWTWTRGTWVEVARGGKQVLRGEAEVYLLSSECNFNAMLTRREASTSRGWLVVVAHGLYLARHLPIHFMVLVFLTHRDG